LEDAEHLPSGNRVRVWDAAANLPKPKDRPDGTIVQTTIAVGNSAWSAPSCSPTMSHRTRGAQLRERLFSPMFFNPIDWTETDQFGKPLSELTER
jgi:hypothetical protein